MIQVLTGHLRREGVQLRSRFGIRGLLVHGALVAIFGVMLPWMRGVGFLDPVMLAAYACLGMLFAPPAAAQAFSSDAPRSMADAAARIAMAVMYGELMALVILAAGLMTVYFSQLLRLPPDIETLAKAAVLGLTGSAALAAVAGWIALRFSAAAARNGLRLIFLALLALFFFKSRWLPEEAAAGAILSAAIAAAAMLAMRAGLPK